VSIKCKAAVLHEIGLKKPYKVSVPLKIEEVEIEAPGPEEVLVKIQAAGICHSDLSVINGDRPRPVPMALGHEGSGIIKEVGNKVKNFEVGDHVVFIFVPPCGSCLDCKEGKPALCASGLVSNTAGTLLSGNRKIKLNGDYINHHVGVSCFSEYAVVSKRSIVKIDKNISFEEAALFGCAIITGAGAVFNTAKIRPGSTVAVIGLGGTGMAALLGAKAAGASQIIGVDLVDEKLKLAKKLGADLVINPNTEEKINDIIAICNGGVDYSFECVGSVNTMELGYKLIKRGGMLISSGLSHPSKSFSIQHVDLVTGEKTIKGSFLGSCIPDRDIPSYIQMYKKGIFPINNIMSNFIKLESINESLDLLEEGKTVRQIIKF
tara:strand:+ start:1676 stop:2806 length:1131 start_codon:yes stop_codon:yes gene_type:complete